MIDEIDVEAERQKSAACPYWESKDDFLALFNFKELDDEVVKRIKPLLWDFRQCFHNSLRKAYAQNPLK